MIEKVETSKTEQFYDIFHKFFCCFPNKVKDSDELEIDFCINSGEDNNLEYADIINDIQSFFPIMYIREDEKNYFQFNQEFIMNFISELSQKDFINKYNDRSLILSILNKREVTDNIPVIRGEMIFKKSLFKKEIPTLESLASCILVPEKRLKVDKNFQDFKILKKINNNTVITRMVSTSQLTMISELEFLEKRTYFFDNGVFYYFCSSIPDDIYPKNNDIERALTYFGVMIIKEDVENFYIDTFNKVDIKMNIPEVLIIMSFPMKMKEFSDGLLHYFNN
jgi:hypothetical protein